LIIQRIENVGYVHGGLFYQNVLQALVFSCDFNFSV